MSTTLAGIDSELREAQLNLAKAQEELIDALERRAPAADIGLMETNVELAIKYRDDLQGTKDYIINQERDKMTRDSKPMTSILYISRWANDFTSDDIPNLLFQSNAKNEMYGITGILYVLRQWFASYLEGDAESMNALIKRLMKDKRHDHFQILDRKDNQDPLQRRYPKSGLVVKYLDVDQGDRQMNPETTMLKHLTQHMALCDFVPDLGWSVKALVEQEEATDKQLAVSAAESAIKSPVSRYSDGGMAAAEAAHISAYEAQVTSVNRFIMYVTTFGPLWDVPDPSDQVEILAKVTALVGEEMARHATHSKGTVVTPHNEGMYCILEGDPSECIDRAVKVFDAIRNNGNLCFTYCPVVALHYGSVNMIMNGTCNITGSVMRYLRQLTTVAEQDGVPVILSHHVADEALRTNVTSHGFYMFDKTPDETFTPNITSSLRWDQLIEKEKLRVEAERQIASHIEGAGPIANVKVKATKRPVRAITTDDFNQEPVKGLITVEELRERFNQLRPDPETDTIALEDFNAMYYGQDAMGVDEHVSEMADLLKQYTTANGAISSNGVPRLTFDQFCLVMYRRER